MLSSEDREGIRRRVAELDDAGLLRLLALDKADYRPEAVEMVRAEVAVRGLRELSREEWLAAVRDKTAIDDGSRAVEFCEDCIAATTDKSPGGTLTVNFAFGTKFIHFGANCPQCNSIVASKYFVVFFVPVFHLGTYRLKYRDVGFFSSTFIGRQLRDERA